MIREEVGRPFGLWPLCLVTQMLPTLFILSHTEGAEGAWTGRLGWMKGGVEVEVEHLCSAPLRPRGISIPAPCEKEWTTC